MAAHEKGSLYALGWIELIRDIAETWMKSITVNRLNQYISSSHPGHLSELKFRLKLFSEAALCSKEIYKIFEDGGLDKEGFLQFKMQFSLREHFWESTTTEIDSKWRI